MRTLAIDDEFVALSKMVTLLEVLGPCDAATSGQQALDLFRKALDDGYPYQLAMIDINMSDMNGLKLLVRFRDEEYRHHMPYCRKLIVTADATASNVISAMTGECDGFLVKPLRRSVLLDKLAALKLLPAGRDRCPASGRTPDLA